MCILSGLCRRTALMVFRYFSYALRRDYIDERVLTLFIGREARRLHKHMYIPVQLASRKKIAKAEPYEHIAHIKFAFFVCESGCAALRIMSVPRARGVRGFGRR